MSCEDQRLAGILIPAFSVRRDQDFGIGDTLGLKDWIDWASRYGVGFLQLLPINENGTDESPYSAISSIAIDPIYLTLNHEEIPWLASREFDKAITKAAELRALNHINYPKVRQAKRNLLELAWAHFEEASAELKSELNAFKKAEAEWLNDYCLFRHLMEIHGESLSWDQWPETCRTPEQAHYLLDQQRRIDPKAVDYRLDYFAFVQWLCFKQWRNLRKHADRAGVKLMGDVPIGIALHSCDVFFNREDFDLEWSGGSPAEGYHPNNPFIHQWGQNWGMPLYRWNRMEANGYRWWHRRIQRLCEIFSIFRLDHILGFYRIYAFPWFPKDNDRFVNLSHDQAAELTGGRLPRWRERPDDTTENCIANHRNGDRRLRSILSQITSAEVIAEDLGWVPDYVRPHLTKLKIAGFKIPHWDCDSSGHPTPPDKFPRLSFASYSTHDHDPIQLVWKSCHHMINTPGAEGHADGAWHTLRILCEFAGIDHGDGTPYPAYSESIRSRLIRALLSSSSKYAVLMVTEVFNLDERINEPGLRSSQNWTFRVPWSVSQIEINHHLQQICHKLSISISLSKRFLQPHEFRSKPSFLRPSD